MSFIYEYHRKVSPKLTFAQRVKEEKVEIDDLEINDAVFEGTKEYWKYLKEGWEILGFEQDGCDDCGFKNYIMTEFWMGGTWEYDHARANGLCESKKSYCEKGIVIDGETYFIHPRVAKLDWDNLTISQIEWSREKYSE